MVLYTILTDFTLTDWTNQQGYNVIGDNLKDFMIEKLFGALGIAKYLDENQCSDTRYPFVNATNGWTSGRIFILFLCHSY
jgi:hypothetical protein